VLQVAAAALVAEDAPCRTAARSLLSSAAPTALAALTPHSTVTIGAQSDVASAAAAAPGVTGAGGGGGAGGGAGGGDGGGSDDSGGAAWWRWRLLTSHAPPLYSPLHLQRTLRLLSGRVPADATSHARLFAACCAASQPALRALVRAEPQLGAWWSAMEAARCLVNSRLRVRGGRRDLTGWRAG